MIFELIGKTGVVFRRFDWILAKFQQSTYMNQWINDEPMETVLYDFMSSDLGEVCQTTAAFNQLANAMICALDGGDPRPILAKEADEYLEECRLEVEAFYDARSKLTVAAVPYFQSDVSLSALGERCLAERDNAHKGHGTRFWRSMWLKIRQLQRSIGNSSRDVGNYGNP